LIQGFPKSLAKIGQPVELAFCRLAVSAINWDDCKFFSLSLYYKREKQSKRPSRSWAGIYAIVRSPRLDSAGDI
jgi:hypothetical protein